ncbi:MAG: radical SAM family heme chaperone HemW [Terrimicrobiaceae bacterium]
MISHLYVHVPFCPKICPYCSFYKTEAARGGFREFVDAVLAEAEKCPFPVQPRTVFFGGGTPTALNNTQLEALISGLQRIFDFSAVQEFTVEMNPATVSPGKASLLRDLGVNRASLGVQSWEAHVLETLGRAHTADMSRKSIEILRGAGFDNLNLDHMFGVPGQTTTDWQRTLARSLEFSPEHLSAYSLTYEEDTEFFEKLGRGEFSPDEGLDADLFESTINDLEASGYDHYETSNYAKPGKACLHNLAYWQGADFLGLGPSAVSTMGHERTKNVADTKEYVRRCQAGVTAADVCETLSEMDRHLERIALGLRTSSGIDASDVPDSKTDRLVENGILEKHAGRLFLTRTSRALADEVALEIA